MVIQWQFDELNKAVITTAAAAAAAAAAISFSYLSNYPV
jgi:hypothetical protein